MTPLKSHDWQGLEPLSELRWSRAHTISSLSFLQPEWNSRVGGPRLAYLCVPRTIFNLCQSTRLKKKKLTLLCQGATPFKSLYWLVFLPCLLLGVFCPFFNYFSIFYNVDSFLFFFFFKANLAMLSFKAFRYAMLSRIIEWVWNSIKVFSIFCCYRKHLPVPCTLPCAWYSGPH